MFKATAKLYDHKRKVLAEHTALGGVRSRHQKTARRSWARFGAMAGDG
jgi:hypothetical protein